MEKKDIINTGEQLKTFFRSPVGLIEITTSEKATRAVGNANGKNPVSIIIPCHRVIGSNGKLIGYGGGLWRKKWLLEFEHTTYQCELFSK